MQEQVVAGSDNGKTGSLVFLSTIDNHIVHIEPYPVYDAKRLYEVIKEYKPVYAVTEQVFMSSGFAHVASTNFEILGRYKQVFEMLDIPYEAIRAVSWRPKLGIRVKGREANKQAAIEKAKFLFTPEDQEKLKTTYSKGRGKNKEYWTDFDDNKCESALIGYYALLQWRQKNEQQ